MHHRELSTVASVVKKLHSLSMSDVTHGISQGSGWALAHPLRYTLLRALAMDNSNQQWTIPVLSASQNGFAHVHK